MLPLCRASKQELLCCQWSSLCELQLPCPRNEQQLGVACATVLVILPYSKPPGIPSLAPGTNTDANRKLYCNGWNEN